MDINVRSRMYFLRTTLESDNEELLWQCYNIIREIEATYRVLDISVILTIHSGDIDHPLGCVSLNTIV